MAMEAVNQKHVYENAMTLHCGQCNTVWSDSLGICGEALDSVICFKVTQDVIVKDELERLEGKTANDCWYGPSLSPTAFGFPAFPLSPPEGKHELKDAMLSAIAGEGVPASQDLKVMCSYIFSSASMVMASMLNFELKPIGKSISELRQKLEAQLEHLSIIEGSTISASGITGSTISEESCR